MKSHRLIVVVILIVAALACARTGKETLPTVTPVPSTPTATAPPTSPGATATPTETQPPEISMRQRLLRATVQIHALVKENDRFTPVWTGSGTIVSPQGLILTNAHVATSYGGDQTLDALGVAITARSDEPPPLKYLARVLFIDYQLDLAVIQIITDMSGTPIDLEALQLYHVDLGDSNDLELGDLLNILGYPGVGGETITFSEGVVSGFIRERGVDGRAWIKTDSMIAPGNSGGLGANQQGELVGVPTLMGESGFINALRPINLARALVEAARLNIGASTGAEDSGSPPVDAPRFENLVFAPGVTEQDQPTQIVQQIPAGAQEIYLFWDYDNMLNGLAWEARWYHEDAFLEAYSWPVSPWGGGERGTWWVNLYSPEPLDEGTYRVELYVAGEMAAEVSVTVGGALSGPALTNLTFAPEVSAAGAPVDPGFLLPAGGDEVYAFFDYARMEDGLSWRYAWSYQGETIAEEDATWAGGPAGSTYVPLTTGSALEPGVYRLRCFVEARLVALAELTIAGTPSEPPFGPITFATGLDDAGRAVDADTAFPAGIEELFYTTEYAGMQDGIHVAERWLLNDEEIFSFSFVWDRGTGGVHSGSLYRTRGAPLPDGTYTLELYVGGERVQAATATIGSGAPPPTPTLSPEGLRILGYILDADTGRGIPGAGYIVLEPGITINSWDGSDAQIYTWAETDANGYFELPLPLERGQQYSILAGAEGYMPVGQDNVPIGNEPSPLEVEVLLQQQ
jgi:S1-C subfamily serine protease